MDAFLITDLAFLKRFPEVDLEIWVMKLKREEYQRKVINVNKWANFSYSNIPKDKNYVIKGNK